VPLLLAAACAPATRPPLSQGAAGEPWVLPAAALGTQRLFRGSYDGPEGDGSFRATLRLASRDRFELVLADRLGRALGSLHVEGSRQRWVDHRRAIYCTEATGIALPGLGNLPLQPEALPPLLLGLLPEPPADPPSGTVALDYLDRLGRRWTAELEEGAPRSWSLWDGTSPLWWWRSAPRGGLLSHREGRQLRWQEVVVEPLPGLAPLGEPPAGYVEDCARTTPVPARGGGP
jgi:hypothetical protein